jgi:hypothetical protein
VVSLVASGLGASANQAIPYNTAEPPEVKSTLVRVKIRNKLVFISTYSAIPEHTPATLAPSVFR